MFPTFISILDIQSWWEVPSIAHFCSLFRTAFDLLDFDIEDLEEALLTDGTEETSWLQELIVRLLRGCLPNNEISTSNYQMFLRRLFRMKCKEHERYNPFNTDHDFQALPLRTKVDILHALCDFRLDAEDVLEQLKNLEADSLRVEPLGYDNNNSAYWYFYGSRLYREDFKTRNSKKVKSVWQVVCFSQDDWFQLAKKFKKSGSKVERHLYRTLSENFLPELPRLFHEKERLARKRLLESLPRRTSNRLTTKKKQEEQDTKLLEQPQPPDDKKPQQIEDEKDKKRLQEKRRQEAYERRTRLREQSENDSDPPKTPTSDSYEMAGKKRTKRQNSSGSSSSIGRGRPRKDQSSKPQGRLTNNSLSSVTGAIVIQPDLNPHRKKLKTSQVFEQTDEDLQTGMHKVLDYVKNHEDAWPFVDPVEEEHAPNYYTVIRKPMDLQRMEERLDSGYYKTFTKFRSDFQLIVDNCRLYNGVDNEYTEMVFNLLSVFEKATERYIDEVTSTDEDVTIEYSGKTVLSPRKPTLVAQPDEKVVVSNDDSDVEKKVKNEKPKKKVGRKPKRREASPVKSRSRSRSLSNDRVSSGSSPPPSWPPSSPESFIISQRNSYAVEEEFLNKGKEKQKDCWNELIADIKKDDKKPTNQQPLLTFPKTKDKHNKLRETIEKLRAKSEISSRFIDFEEDLDYKRKNDFKFRKKLDYNEEIPKKPNADIEALTLATEQTLKDINKWLDDTPRLSEFSSASNSPSQFSLELDGGARHNVALKKDPPTVVKEVKQQRRTFHRDPKNFLKKREVQRTIDRLQPGKSKGNLIANIPAAQKEDILPLSKIKETKNALIVKPSEAAPKLSLGTVLDSFGKHKFVEEGSKKQEDGSVEEVVTPGKATPNLSAWFKAFGAPKAAAPVVKKPEVKEVVEAKPQDEKKVPPPEVSPPQPRQRRMSNGSTVSEQSSFSQDMDSPRVDERLYPAPYPSPLHNSPSGTPVLSPRPDISPKSAYPTVNGQIRVGFYQDTASTKSSPDKSGSPRDNPQYEQQQQHVYAPVVSENVSYTYSGNNYYYTNSAGLPEAYEANKPLLTEQYQAPVKPYQDFQPPTTSPLPVNYESFRQPVKKRYNEPPEIPYDLNNERPQYVHQNIPNPRAVLNNQPAYNSYNNYNNDAAYQMMQRALAHDPTANKNIDMSKYTNMGYTGETYTRNQYSEPPPVYTAPKNMVDLTNLVERFTPTAENMYFANKPVYNEQFQQQAAPQPEKKKRRKKTEGEGFQTYALKEPSAISLKTSSAVPGSAFNFGLYGDNFLDDYRNAPNYYMAAAAAHHRASTEVAPQTRPNAFPFIPPQAPPLMDANSPLYQQYLQAGVLHQGLLGPHGAYTYPAMMRQQFDSMTRPSWL